MWRSLVWASTVRTHDSMETERASKKDTHLWSCCVATRMLLKIYDQEDAQTQFLSLWLNYNFLSIYKKGVGMNFRLNSICIQKTTTLCKYFKRSDQDSAVFGPRQANLVLVAYASSEGSGEPAHPRSLARTSAARSYKQWVKRNLQTESQIPGPSEWLGMRS